MRFFMLVPPVRCGFLQSTSSITVSVRAGECRACPLEVSRCALGVADDSEGHAKGKGKNDATDLASRSAGPVELLESSRERDIGTH